jgi:hypothetical protein
VGREISHKKVDMEMKTHNNTRLVTPLINKPPVAKECRPWISNIVYVCPYNRFARIQQQK